jgi:hypothetical protein
MVRRMMQLGPRRHHRTVQHFGLPLVPLYRTIIGYSHRRHRTVRRQPSRPTPNGNRLACPPNDRPYRMVIPPPDDLPHRMATHHPYDPPHRMATHHPDDRPYPMVVHPPDDRHYRMVYLLLPSFSSDVPGGLLLLQQYCA